MPTDPEKNNFNDPYTQTLLNLIKEQYDRELVRIDKRIDTGFSEIKDELKNYSEETSNQIQTVENKINNKLDAVDEALRGNGRIGIFEQLRSLRAKMLALFFLVALLFGLKLWGLGLNEWIEEFWFGDVQKTQQVEKETPQVEKAEP